MIRHLVQLIGADHVFPADPGQVFTEPLLTGSEVPVSFLNLVQLIGNHLESCSPFPDGPSQCEDDLQNAGFRFHLPFTPGRGVSYLFLHTAHVLQKLLQLRSNGVPVLLEHFDLGPELSLLALLPLCIRRRR